MVQGLRLQASTAGSMGSIPGQGTKIPHATWYGHKKPCCNSMISKQPSGYDLADSHVVLSTEREILHPRSLVGFQGD